MMQETKVSNQGKLNFDGCITYKHTRTDKEGGVLALCALADLKPAFIRDGGDMAGTLTVNIYLKQITISCTKAYGRQESAPLARKKKQILEIPCANVNRK